MIDIHFITEKKNPNNIKLSNRYIFFVFLVTLSGSTRTL